MTPRKEIWLHLLIRQSSKFSGGMHVRAFNTKPVASKQQISVSTSCTSWASSRICLCSTYFTPLKNSYTSFLSHSVFTSVSSQEETVSLLWTWKAQLGRWSKQALQWPPVTAAGVLVVEGSVENVPLHPLLLLIFFTLPESLRGHRTNFHCEHHTDHCRTQDSR